MKNYSKEFLTELLRKMERIRFCEESLVAPILSGEVRCPCHLCSGQEAVAVGLCAALDPIDYIFGNHRSHGHYLAKGGDLNEMVAEIFCREGGCSGGRGGSMHLIAPESGILGCAPIVAGTISLAVGAALASSVRKDGRVTVSFFGDGATGEGVLYESLNFASLRKLPIIFACENNLYATHMPIRECRVNNFVYKIAETFCVQNKQIDGNDILEVYEASKWATDQCRTGNGPVFLEFLTYRFRGHVGPDDNIQGCHTDIRPQEEVNAWLRKDPITRFETLLKENMIFPEDSLIEIRKEVEQEVAQAFELARRSTFPGESELMINVFTA